MNSVTNINHSQADAILASYYLKLANGDKSGAKAIKQVNEDLFTPPFDTLHIMHLGSHPRLDKEYKVFLVKRLHEAQESEAQPV